MYKIINKTFQVLILTENDPIPSRKNIIVKTLNNQLKNLEKRGLVIIKKQ